MLPRSVHDQLTSESRETLIRSIFDGLPSVIDQLVWVSLYGLPKPLDTTKSFTGHT